PPAFASNAPCDRSPRCARAASKTSADATAATASGSSPSAAIETPRNLRRPNPKSSTESTPPAAASAIRPLAEIVSSACATSRHEGRSTLTSETPPRPSSPLSSLTALLTMTPAANISCSASPATPTPPPSASALTTPSTRSNSLALASGSRASTSDTHSHRRAHRLPTHARAKSAAVVAKAPPVDRVPAAKASSLRCRQAEGRVSPSRQSTGASSGGSSAAPRRSNALRRSRSAEVRVAARS
ncbi:unnamed protein product, partial [Ectocarpus sp. 4 AP-2014]